MIELCSIIEFLEDKGLRYKYIGDQSLQVKYYSTPGDIKDYSIVWIKSLNLIEACKENLNKNILIVTSYSEELENIDCNFLFSNNSKELFFSIVAQFFYKEERELGIRKSSVVETAQIGKNVSIGHNCYIGEKVTIHDNVVIKNNVVLEGEVTIGANTIVCSGVIIGSDGYGYFKNEKGESIKVPHLGGVQIGKNVEIGANTCIDRGTLGDTIIEDNVKIDNLCHIAHNVHIQKNVNVIALSMIAGSVILRENSYIAPAAAIMNQLTIGENSIVGLGAVVVKNVKENEVVAGVPAKVIRKVDDL